MGEITQSSIFFFIFTFIKNIQNQVFNHNDISYISYFKMIFHTNFRKTRKLDDFAARVSVRKNYVSLLI